MDQWQGINGDSMFAEDWQLLISIVDEAAAEDARIYLEVAPVQLALDRDLPQTGYAEKQFVSWSRHERAGAARYARGAFRRPDQKVCVQQQLHSSPSKSF